MDEELACACGRIFSQVNALSNHRRRCSKSKKRIFTALSKAKEVWSSNKRLKQDTPPETEANVNADDAAGPALDPRIDAQVQCHTVMTCNQVCPQVLPLLASILLNSTINRNQTIYTCQSQRENHLDPVFAPSDIVMFPPSLPHPFSLLQKLPQLCLHCLETRLMHPKPQATPNFSSSLLQ
jgi:hypothetical protein